MSDLRGVPRERFVPLRQRGGYALIAMPSTQRAATFQSVVAAIGYETVVVRDGEGAREELARRGAPDLAILDLSLPKLDGFEVLREIRLSSPRTQSGAIVVSGHAAFRTAARRLSEQLGISRILPFDIDRAALREAIDATLEEISPPRTAAAVPVATANPPEHRGEPLPSLEEAMDAAVSAASRRFRVGLTVAYVKSGLQEQIRGFFRLSDTAATINGPYSFAFLKQFALASDTLIVPNLTNYPAVADIAPGGLPLVRGFAATPIGVPTSAITGTLCVMDAQPLELDAGDLDALEGIARELTRNLGGHAAASAGDESSTKPSAVDIDSLERLASADPLTGLANRRGGEKDIAAEISRARRQNTPLSCVLLDIDHFKDVNDTFGHQAGDYVLREISALLRRTVRAYDILVRWGGEEFLVVLPGVDQEQALKLAERIRLAIENLPLAGIGGVTASVGVAGLGSDYSFDAMFAAADRRLYSAKSAGRNTVA